MKKSEVKKGENKNIQWFILTYFWTFGVLTLTKKNAKGRQKNFCKHRKRKVKKVLGGNLPGDTFLKKVNIRIFFSGVYVGDFIRVCVGDGVFCLQDVKKQTPDVFSSKRVQQIIFLPYIFNSYKNILHRLPF